MPTLIYWIRRARARFGLALAVVSLGLAAPALAGGSEQMLKACFEVQAARAMDNARTPDELTRNLAAMAAGKLCHEAVANAVHACLADVEDGRVRRVQSYYRCIGRAANICIDSKWATDEFRRVVCADAEEAAWLAMMQADLEAMKPMLAGGPDEDLLRGMEATHFAARDAACGLARHVNEKTGPHIGYAACAAEMAGRFAIDARVLRRTLAAAKRQKQQERPPFNGPGDASGLGLVSKATAHAIAACWNDTAAPTAEGADRESEAIRESVTMSAGGECRINMHDALKECLAATGDEHQCVARIADKCLGASRWAKNEMRRAACLEAEDLTWVARYQEAAGALKDMLDDEGRALLGNASAARRQHSGYACEMFRNAAGSDNRIAWADCRMQASARLAIDIRDLARTAGALSEPEREPGQEDEGEDKNADEPGGVIPDPTDARKHSRKDIGGDGAPGTPTQEVAGVVRPKATLWGALAFTAGGSYASAWRHATKAEAEAAVLKDCTKLDEGRCEVISFEGKYCAALASYRTSAKRKILRGAFTGAGETVTAAQASAHEQCKAAMIRRGVRGECSLRAVLCGDGR